jgi:hypothetical protein
MESFRRDYMSDKRYCNGCVHAKFRAGVEPTLAKRLNITDCDPYPTHTCLKYGIKRERRTANISRLPICKKEKSAAYPMVE